MKKLILLMAVMVLALMMVSSASAAWYKVTAVNGTGGVVNDFHVVFTGTDGSIANLTIITDPGTNANATVTGGSEVDITWDVGSVASGATLVFSFSADVGDLSGTAEWTIEGEAAGDVTILIVESPSSLPSLTQYGLIALAILIALTGLWMYRKRRATA